MVSIKYKKLFSYLNPFKDKLPGKDYLFRMETVTNYLRRGDNFVNIEDSTIEKDYKKIAYMISNTDHLFVKINVPTEENDFSHMLFEENDNVLAYVALYYLKHDTINVDLQGSGKFAKTLFGVPGSKDYSFNQTAIVIDNMNNTLVDWTINESLLMDSWGDIDFVLSNISNENIDVNKKLIAPELWNNEKFFKGILKKIGFREADNKIFNYLMKEHKYNTFTIDYLFQKHDTLPYFKSYYLNDYKKYKQDTIVHSNQALIEQYIVNHKTLMNWMRHLYSKEAIQLCFPLDMLQSQDIIVEWYKIKLSGGNADYNPLLESQYRDGYLKSFVVEQSKDWKIQTFDKLVCAFLEDNRRNNNSLDKFKSVFSELLMDKHTQSLDFYHLIKDLPFSKQAIYLHSFIDYYKKSEEKINICEQLSTLIIEQYPQYFAYLDEQYRTLENLKKTIKHKVIISSEELLKYNDKPLNLLMIENGFSGTFLNTFPLSYILDEDYLSLLIRDKNHSIRETKSVFKFVEKNHDLIKECIKVGWHNLVSQKVFENKELGEFLIGTVFSHNYKSDFYSFSKDNVLNLVNPAIFSNLDSLKNILTISHGGYLKKTQHLFKQKQFSQMVFKLFDRQIITNKDYLPVEVRLVLDSFKINHNYEDFFNKYDLQNNLNKKFAVKNTNKTTHKI